MTCGLWASGEKSDTERIRELEDAARGRRDQRVYFNLGVLYARSGDAGHAVLNLRRAGLLDPSDREARQYLNTLRESIGIPSYLFELNPVEKVFSFPFTVLTLNAAAVFGLVLFAAGSVILSLSFLRVLPETPRFPARWPRAAGIALAALGFIYLGSALIRYRLVFNARSAVIVRDSGLLERPEGASVPVDEVPAGLECRVTGREAEYLLVRTADGREGWVRSDAVTRLWE